MRKTLAISMMLAAALGLAACDKKSEDKAQDAAAHSEQAQKDMAKAQDKVNDAAKENADACHRFLIPRHEIASLQKESPLK
jgi:cytochrome c5